MSTTLETIKFNYSEADAVLFENDQSRHWRRIEEYYSTLRERCLDEIPMPIEATHKVWVTSRVNRLLVTSIMRLLYLGESFCDSTLKFNTPSAAVHVKAMVEPVLHIANLAWILEHHHNSFEQIRIELDRMAFGNRATGELTTSARITQKELYTRADDLMKGYGGSEAKDELNVFEILYKEANASGHHNFEGRDMLVGVTDKNNVWHPKNRKEWFVFISSNIFQFFLHTGVVFSMSTVFVNHIDHYLENMPESLPKPPNGR
jgi:hypothetical protein